MEKTKVLYIAGWGRSGSTIIEAILAQIEGFFAVGELRYIWDRNLIDNRLCGCGERFLECSLWGEVLESAFGGLESIDPREMVRCRESCSRTRHLPLLITSLGKRYYTRKFSEYHGNLGRLYRAIASVAGCKVIIDSSKFPSYASVLTLLPDIDLHIVHLVRDPRAVAYSWSRDKLQPDTEDMDYMKKHGKFASSLLWLSWNAFTEYFWRKSPDRYLRIRYEDFVRSPRSVLSEILELIDMAGASLPLINDNEVELVGSHTVSGNPVRFNTGRIKIKPDLEWESRMNLMDKFTVKCLTFPLFKRYNYLNL